MTSGWLTARAGSGPDRSAWIVRMAYHGDGKRVKRVYNYGTVIYIGPRYERNEGTGADTSDVTTKMYWAQLGSTRRLVAVNKGGNLSYLYHDHLGSTKAISGTSGGPMRYYPFGSTYQEIASPPTDNLYTAQKRDLSTGWFTTGRGRQVRAMHAALFERIGVANAPES